MKKEFTTQDMVDFVKHYDGKAEKDCFDTFEEELNEFLAIRKEKKLGSFSIIPRFSQEQIELNKDAIDTAIAACDWDNYLKDKYESPKEQITDLYWLKDTLNRA